MNKNISLCDQNTTKSMTKPYEKRWTNSCFSFPIQRDKPNTSSSSSVEDSSMTANQTGDPELFVGKEARNVHFFSL